MEAFNNPNYQPIPIHSKHILMDLVITVATSSMYMPDAMSTIASISMDILKYFISKPLLTIEK